MYAVADSNDQSPSDPQPLADYPYDAGRYRKNYLPLKIDPNYVPFSSQLDTAADDSLPLEFDPRYDERLSEDDSRSNHDSRSNRLPPYFSDSSDFEDSDSEPDIADARPPMADSSKDSAATAKPVSPPVGSVLQQMTNNVLHVYPEASVNHVESRLAELEKLDNGCEIVDILLNEMSDQRFPKQADIKPEYRKYYCRKFLLRYRP